MATVYQTITLTEEDFIKHEEQLLQDILGNIEKLLTSKLQASPFGYRERTAKETAADIIQHGVELNTNSGGRERSEGDDDDDDDDEDDDEHIHPVNKFSGIKKVVAILFQAPCARLFKKEDDRFDLDKSLELDAKKRKFESENFMSIYPGFKPPRDGYYVKQSEVLDSATMMSELMEFIENDACAAAMCVIVFFGHGSEDESGLCFNKEGNKHLNDFLKEIDEKIIKHKDPDTDLPKSTRIIFAQCHAHHFDYRPKCKGFEVVKFTHDDRKFTVTVPRYSYPDKKDIVDAKNLDANDYAHDQAELE